MISQTDGVASNGHVLTLSRSHHSEAYDQAEEPYLRRSYHFSRRNFESQSSDAVRGRGRSASGSSAVVTRTPAGTEEADYGPEGVNRLNAQNTPLNCRW